MGQYHKVVNMTAHAYLDNYELGCGAKAWEQTGGGIPAALAALLADKPGNMPADLGQHPMVGQWAGHRLLVVGDYAENRDIRKFEGPASLSRIYGLCRKEPQLGDFTLYIDITGKRLTKQQQFDAALRKWERASAKGDIFQNVAPQIRGAIEFALSTRYCGDRGWQTGVPVKPFAERGLDGHLHYVLSNTLTRESAAKDLAMLWRLLGLGGCDRDPAPDPTKLPPGLDRWPWDRPPADLSWHNATTAQADEGQRRVFANLDRREFFDPIAFGEQPTTAGIMRAADVGANTRMAMDMVVSSPGDIQTNVKTGSADGFSSASALFAMLLHPEPRGSGDIDPSDFPEVGRWRNNRLVLTAEIATDLPSTSDVLEGFLDITPTVLRSLTTLAAAA